MTKEQLIDTIKDRLAGGDCPQEIKGRYHPEIISKHITLVLNYLIKSVAYKEAEMYGWGILDGYSKAYKDVDVVFDASRNEYYSFLPCSVVQLPMNRGVRMISPMHDQKYNFIYRENNSISIYQHLDVDKIKGIPRFYVEGNKVFYSDQFNSDYTKLLMKVIPDFDSLDDEDEAQVPTAYGKMIFDLVVQSMQGKPFEKISNDNNPNQP